MERVTSSAEEMDKAAVAFASQLAPKGSGATVVTLSGDLGAGKTTFARGVARAFGIEESVTSPTFVIEKIYLSECGPFKRLVHIDAYRLNGAHDLDVLGWKELLQDAGNLVLLEWPEKVEGAIPAEAVRISLDFEGADSRKISYARTPNLPLPHEEESPHISCK